MDEPDIPDVILQRIREVIPHVLGGNQPDPNRNEPMPYRRPDGKDLIDGEDERGFAVTPVPKSTSGTIGSFVGQVSVSPDTLLNDFPAGMDGQTPILLSVSDSTKIYAHATVNGAGVATARAVTAGASVPADDPKTGDFYWELASVTMAAGGADNVPVITVDQIRWGPIEELQRYFREFHIQPSGANRAIVFTGTLFGSLPTGFSVNNAPFFELTGLASGDKIYAKVTYARTVPDSGASSISTRTIAKAATVPANNTLTGTRHFQIASVTGLDANNFPIISQTRWGPIDNLPGTAVNRYEMPPAALVASYPTYLASDFFDLTLSSKGEDTYANDLAPTYDAISFLDGTGFVRFVDHKGNLRAHVRKATINSIGQTTYAGPEILAVDFSPDRREFHIEPSSAYTVEIYNGTLFGSMPAGFSVDDSPIFTLTVANGDKIYAKVTWDRRVLANGDIVSTISGRTIAAAAAVPADNNLTATRHYQLATVTLGAGNIPVVSQSRWGPIDDLPGTALYNYHTSGGSTTAQVDYWDLLYTRKGKQADGTTDIAPTYDSIQINDGAFMRAVVNGTNLLLFARDATLNSQGQFTYASVETKVFDKPVVCETTVDVLVGLRLNGTQLQGQYRTIKVNAVTTPSPDWVNLVGLTTSGTTIDVS